MFHISPLVKRFLGGIFKKDESEKSPERAAVSFISNTTRNVNGEVEVTYHTVYLSSMKRVKIIRLLRGLVESTFKRYQDVLSGDRDSTDLMDHLIGSLCSKVWEMEPEDIKNGDGTTVPPAILTEDVIVAGGSGPTAVDAPAIRWGESTLPGVLIDLHDGLIAVGQPIREGRTKQGVSATQWYLHDANARYQASETLAKMAGEGISYWQ